MKRQLRLPFLLLVSPKVQAVTKKQEVEKGVLWNSIPMEIL
jgi:hypothetical protein